MCRSIDPKDDDEELNRIKDKGIKSKKGGAGG